MIAEQWEHIKELFETALNCSLEERQSLLMRLAAEDPGVADQVVRLLASYEKAGDFLVEPCCPSPDFLEDLGAEQQRFFPDDVVCGRFRIVTLLGRGGMGEVYKAWDEELEDRVALKTLRPEISTHELFTSRFRREIQLARKVTHPNVCRIFDSFKHAAGDGTYISVLSMELLQGQTLADHLKAKGRLSAAEAMPLVQQIVAGLSAIHAAGIIHRDLKPANLVLVPATGATTNTAAYEIKITDFGIAGRSPDSLSPGVQTEASKLLGTPDYMAPEQIEYGRANVQSDIYSLGLILYEMVTGLKQFAASNAWKRLYGRVPNPAHMARDLNESWRRTILRCLERDPVLRPHSVNSVLTLLRTRPARKWPVYAVAVIAFSLLMILAIWKLRPHYINPEAQAAADLARSAIKNLSQDGFTKAIEEYKRACDLDPEWAQAWAELAYAYAAASNARYIDSNTALTEGRKAALRAIELDPSLAKAHGALAWTQSLDFDEWPKAEDTFRNALRLDPNDGQIHYWFGVHLRKKGKFRAAEDEDKHALTLTHAADPNVWSELAFLYWTSGQTAKLHEHLLDQLKIFPNAPLTRYIHARSLKLEGRFQQAADELSFAERLGLNPLTVLVERVSLEEYSGDLAAARRGIAQLEEAAKTKEIDGLLLAGDYAGLHDYDAAFSVLEAAFRRKDNTLLSVATSPVIEPLRRDARYRSLLMRLHFTDQIMQQTGFN